MSVACSVHWALKEMDRAIQACETYTAHPDPRKILPAKTMQDAAHALREAVLPRLGRLAPKTIERVRGRILHVVLMDNRTAFLTQPALHSLNEVAEFLALTSAIPADDYAATETHAVL